MDQNADVPITITVYELDIVMKSLMKQPWEVVNGIITKIHGQANAVLNPSPQGVQDVP